MHSTATITQQSALSISLQPHIAIINSRRKSSTRRTTSPSSASTLSLPSPSIVAARAYYLERAASGFGSPIFRRESLIEGQLPARSESLIGTSRQLTTQLDNFTFEGGLDTLAKNHEDEVKTESIKVDPDFKADKISPTKRRDSFITPRTAEFLFKVPFEYTHNHLREWGYVYLGDTSTADVFVDAIALRRESTKEGHGSSFPHKLTTIRARVFPITKHRKPFLIQKDFDIEALRATIPSPKEFSRFPPRRNRRSVSRRCYSSKQSRTKTEIEHFYCAFPIRKLSHSSYY